MTPPSGVEVHQTRAASPGATLALAGVTGAVAVGMARLFAGGEYLVPLLVATVVAHLVMWQGRRLRIPLLLSAVLALAAVALAGVWLLLPGSTVYGVPGPGSLDAALRTLREAWAQFGDVVAPTPPTDGFLLAAMLGLGITAVLADWAAFRARVLFEAVVPSFTLFVFTATLGAGGSRGLMVALYLAALLVFLVLHRADLESARATWFASRTRGGAGGLLQTAGVLGVLAILSAVVIGPRLPGAGADGVFSWRDSGRQGGDRRTTISPLVDIRGRLVGQSNTEVFSVKANQKAYWRLTSLDTFDGQIWSSDASYSQIGQRIPSRRGGSPPTEAVTQEFTIRSLSSIWLPAAYRPLRVMGAEDVSYNSDLGSLITGQSTTDGLRYQVESAVPSLTSGDLAHAATPLLDDGRFVKLPPVSPRVSSYAQFLIRTAQSPYAQALALQNSFRTGFVYDLMARPGHDEGALESFLFTTKRGYCEQFAGAFAVLARSIGLPTRVAVGFTPGELGSDGRYHVRGLNAHAWPEVYFAGSGWVAFEPTPGRGAPGAQAYTGIPEAQARPENPSTATTAVPTTTAAPRGESTPTTTATSLPTEAENQASRSWSGAFGPLLLAVLGTVLLGAGAIPVAKVARRRRRRSRAHTPADQVWVAWAEVEEVMARAGAPRAPSETLSEHARRASARAGLAPAVAGALSDLAESAAAASYAPGDLLVEEVQRATGAVPLIEAAINISATRRQRLAWFLDPRPLVRSTRSPSTARRHDKWPPAHH